MRATFVGRRNCRGVPIAHNSNEHNATNASFHWCVVLKWCCNEMLKSLGSAQLFGELRLLLVPHRHSFCPRKQLCLVFAFSIDL